MATVIGVMDEPGLASNTDVLVVAEPGERTLTWIPRDLWSPVLDDRINRAFTMAGHAGLIEALAEAGVAAQHSVVVGREACAAALKRVRVEVPVRKRIMFRYPRSGDQPIEQGDRLVIFEPPAELLAGERVHEWIGARYGVAPAGRAGRSTPGEPEPPYKPTGYGDLSRLKRQQELVGALLEQGFDFGVALAASSGSSAISGPRALAELNAVDADWTRLTLGGLKDARIRGKEVLVRRRLLPPTPRRALVAALAKGGAKLGLPVRPGRG